MDDKKRKNTSSPKSLRDNQVTTLAMQELLELIQANKTNNTSRFNI